MVGDSASVIALDTCGVPDMVDVAMREEEEIHGMVLLAEPGGCILRGIHENSAAGQVEAVGVENAACKSIHVHDGGECVGGGGEGARREA